MPLPRPLAAALLAVVVAFGTASSAVAVTVLFSEDFEGIPLGTSPTYQLPGVWSSDPPSGPLQGWDRRDDLPGFSNPSLGVLEFKGWNFWEERSWKEVAGGARRRFSRAEGTVAVADPDTWNDFNNPASLGTYNTFLETPQIPLDGVGPLDTRLVLGFDTSWRGGCCTSGQDFDNNQTAIIRARINGGSPIEVFRWESSRFREGPNGEGRPTNDPIDAAGNNNTPNQFFVQREFDDRVFTPDLFDLLSGSSASGAGEGFAASSTSGGHIQFEFAMEDAGDDGWWAVDNIQFASIPEPTDGDLYIDGVLDALDIDEFAFGMLNEDAYEDAWFGESPGTRGSPDSEFDFDDIPWFLALMEGKVAEPAMLLSYALQGIPEPSTAALIAIGSLAISGVRPGRGIGG